MNTQEVVPTLRGRFVMTGIAIITAASLTACGGGTVAGQVTVTETVDATSVAPTATHVEPTTAFDNIPIEENPFLWSTATPYSGTLHVEGLNLDLRNPVPEVQDHIDAVANLGSRCMVTLSGQYGTAPESFGVFVYTNPKDLGDFNPTYSVNAASANTFVHGFDNTCN